MSNEVIMSNEEILNKYKTALSDIDKDPQNDFKLTILKKAAIKLGEILIDDEANKVIKTDIQTIKDIEDALLTNDYTEFQNNINKFEPNNNSFKEINRIGDGYDDNIIVEILDDEKKYYKASVNGDYKWYVLKINQETTSFFDFNDKGLGAGGKKSKTHKRKHPRSVNKKTSGHKKTNRK
jgi:hypothetical protein